MSEGRRIQLRTPFGRLEGREYGDARGEALLFFHGFPGCSLQAAFLPTRVGDRRLRVIAFDRPGYGGSEAGRFNRARFLAELESWLAREKIDRLYLAAVSGGAPYALKAAAQLGERVRATALLCGLAPWPHSAPHFPPLFRLAAGFARHAPRRVLAGAAAGLFRELMPEPGVPFGSPRAHAVDQALLADPAIQGRMAENLTEALKGGWAGVALDLKAYTRPLPGKELLAPLLLWHGDHDQVVPLEMSRAIASAFPQARLRILPGEGHFTLPIRRAREALTELLGAAAPSATR